MHETSRAAVNILLVDDQPARLLSYELILSELGQNLVQARSGTEALERLMKDDFAVVLLDVSMPGMDGFETAAMIHDHPRFERTPIIFVTGVHINELDRLKGYKLGAVDYVSIPVVPEILRSKVAVLVELYCQRLELLQLNHHLAQANEQLERANTTLQAEKTRELEAMNGILQLANQELAAANRSLHAEIAERLRAEGALREADRHKDEFLAILAHELRNPLAPIRNAVEIMSRVPVENRQVVWSREVIDRQAAHLARLVDDLLDVSRITRGTINLMREPLTVGTIVARAIETLQPVIAEHKHELTIDCEDESLVVEGDLTRLTQVLGNLLSNAAKYTNNGGHIGLVVRRQGELVELRVRDDGIGIPAESIPRLFSLFSRLKSGPDRLQGGLGIGLALVRKLVDMHGGEVSVQSAGEGQGSEFVVRLPLKSVDSSPQQLAQPSPDETATGSFRRRIVVADDNRDALDSLALLLECAGHEVYKAEDGTEAVEMVLRHRPELALLDIGMPTLDGYQAARSIRQQFDSREVMLVAVSGWGQHEDMRRSRESGFDRHLVKPVTFETLAEVLALLPAQASDRERFARNLEQAGANR